MSARAGAVSIKGEARVQRMALTRCGPSTRRDIKVGFQGAAVTRRSALDDRSSAIAVIRVSAVVGRLWFAFLTFEGRRWRIIDLTEPNSYLRRSAAVGSGAT
jgi:hypothetical protein